MKTGIVTVQDSANLGSFLQALGMQELIKLHGDTPVFIRSRNSFETLLLYLDFTIPKSQRTLKCFIHFCLQRIVDFKGTVKGLAKYRAYRRDRNCFEKVLSVKKANACGLDALLLGSDEIWNVNKVTLHNPYLYGIGIAAKNKTAYAISLGNATAEQMLSFPQLSNGISNLNTILYRDEHTGAVLRECGFETAERICDPTLQVDIKKYMKQPDTVALPQEDFIAVYSYNVSENDRTLIQRFAREHHLKTVAVSLSQNWCDSYLNCSPLEFGAVLNKASYVYTSTFHGTIFASIYHTHFICRVSLQKISDVLRLLSLQDHTLPENTDYNTFCSMLEQDYCYDTMDERLSELRTHSFDLYEKYVKEKAVENSADL